MTMKFSAIITAATLAAFTAAPATAVPFDVTGFDLEFGPGFEAGGNNGGSTVALEFLSTGTEVPIAFDLTDSFSFLVGEYLYDEGSTAGEVSIPAGDLGAVATFSFADGSTLALTGQGTVFATGDETDEVEFTLDFGSETIIVDGQEVAVSLSAFSVLASTPTSLTEDITATFASIDIPAPGALALFGVGLAGVGAVRRRS